jgi:putative serine protease PepD
MEHRWRLGWVLVALLVMIAGVAAIWSPSSSSASSGDSPVPASASALQDAYIDVLHRVRPSVVEISTESGLGSGVIYNGDGDIVTNAHVVQGAMMIRVRLPDGRTLRGTVVGSYEPDDLAVVHVDASGLEPASFADSSKVRVGDIVLAIGNPLGLSGTVTDGIVSATARTVDEGDGVVLPSTIQTSAAINPGNSGGGLVDLDGRVIGIPTLVATDPELGGSAPGIGFAIPSSTVKLIADQLIANGAVTMSDRAGLGVTGATATSSDGSPVGVLVVSARRRATRAGIAPGDIITRVGGTQTPTIDALLFKIAHLAPGRRTAVTILHPNGDQQTYTIVLGAL